ncbi:MAG: His/Gly/Thr/Pro-type tRNA ligase C-terminal domain-containing protein, partial [Acidimicrobiales bacterium]
LLRVAHDGADEPLGARIRRWKLDKVPYVVVVGDQDVAAGTVGVNRRGAQSPERGVGLEAFVARLQVEVERRGVPESGPGAGDGPGEPRAPGAPGSPGG